MEMERVKFLWASDEINARYVVMCFFVIMCIPFTFIPHTHTHTHTHTLLSHFQYIYVCVCVRALINVTEEL